MVTPYLNDFVSCCRRNVGIDGLQIDTIKLVLYGYWQQFFKGCISLSWGRKGAMAERIEGEWSVTTASEGSQRGYPTCTRT